MVDKGTYHHQVPLPPAQPNIENNSQFVAYLLGEKDFPKWGVDMDQSIPMLEDYVV